MDLGVIFAAVMLLALVMIGSDTKSSGGKVALVVVGLIVGVLAFSGRLMENGAYSLYTGGAPLTGW